jgi:predicted DNA-binding protein YlxM (UPF0122 family)
MEKTESNEKRINELNQQAIPRLKADCEQQLKETEMKLKFYSKQTVDNAVGSLKNEAKQTKDMNSKM